jgi:hypothetical protein
MRISATGFGLLAGVLALSLCAVAPASADSSSSRATQELAAQSRPSIVVHPRTSFPGPNAKRYCRSRLAKEYRVSGTVIVPRMRCWWR